MHLKQVRPGWNTRAEIDIGNTIEYDIKLYQVKMTVVNCTDIWIKGLKTLTAHRKDVGVSNMYVTQIIKFQMRCNYVNGDKFE